MGTVDGADLIVMVARGMSIYANILSGIVIASQGDLDKNTAMISV
ncbi:hypothetical protein [Rugamonas apoptosis]|nr:hypothetical protein [Rugamonas apoptosis]